MIIEKVLVTVDIEIPFNILIAILLREETFQAVI